MDQDVPVARVFRVLRLVRYVIIGCVLEDYDGAILGILYAIRNAHLESSLPLNSVLVNLLVFIRAQCV